MQSNRNATGHVKLVSRKRGDQRYVKYRRPDGHQVERKLGPAWTGAGRPPAGHYTRRTAEEALQALLTDARRGSLDSPASGAASPTPPLSTCGTCGTCGRSMR